MNTSFRGQAGIVLKQIAQGRGIQVTRAAFEEGCSCIRGRAGQSQGTIRTASGFSPRADFDDTATYSAVATNVHGQVSTNVAVVVRSECALGVGGGCSRLLSPFSTRRDRPAVLQGSGVTRSRSIRWGSRLDVS